jgi:hypothetical protein
MLDPTQIPDHVPLGLAQTAAAIRTSKQIKKTKSTFNDIYRN